ncbi:MAG: M48 family metallopeptidase [Spirochaetaceae bacterium]|nr:M48 family metallopeptidase [Spirochaetaceae bacterium]
MDRRTRAELLRRLERDALRICSRFELRYRVLEAERANVTSRYGVCYSDGTIRIRLRHATTGRPLKYSSLVNTLCHELAHLRHFNHGPRFQTFYAQILEWARREGIYRPGRLGPSPAERAPVAVALARAGTPARDRAQARPPRSAEPMQLDLFR